MKDEQYYRSFFNQTVNEIKELKHQLHLKCEGLSEMQDFINVCVSIIRSPETIKSRIADSIKKEFIQNKEFIEIYPEIGSTCIHKYEYRIDIKKDYYENEYDSIDHRVEYICLTIDDSWIPGPYINPNIKNPQYIQEIDDLYEEWLQILDKIIKDVCRELNLVITEKSLSSITSFKFIISKADNRKE